MTTKSVRWTGTYQDMRGPNGTRVRFSKGVWIVLLPDKSYTRHDSRAYAMSKGRKLDKALGTAPVAQPVSSSLWMYDSYRATLRCDGEFFALVSEGDGKNALSKDKIEKLLSALNGA